MATAMVFVDDAVLGNLPPICVKTGIRTDDHMNLSSGVGTNDGLGLAWLLVLAGPIGWVGLFIFAASRREEVLTVRLPYSESAYRVFDEIRRLKRVAGVAALALFLGALVSLTPLGRTSSFVLALGGCVALGVFVVEAIQAKRALVDVRLDGSRRWVTLNRVHNNFAGAVAELNRDRMPTQP